MGIPLPLLLLFAAIFYVFFVYSLFKRTEWAGYLIGTLGLYYYAAQQNKPAIHFLRTSFSKSDFVLINCIEWSLIFIPVISSLLIYKAWLPLTITVLVSMLLQWELNSNRMPTVPVYPFNKNPWEYMVGIRAHWIWILFLFVICVIAIYVGNFNLGLFGMLALGGIAATFYIYPEPKEIVWLYNRSAKKFLGHKIRVASLQYVLIVILPMVFLWLFFPGRALWILITLPIAILWIILLILAKYAAFPREISISQSVLIGVGILCPILLPYVIYTFYTKSILNLKTVLA
jgi:hypothetical protein